MLVGATLSSAQAWLSDLPELFDRIPARDGVDDEKNDDYLLGDDDWGSVSDRFDDRCRWDEWEVPLLHDHPLLPAVLAKDHPFTWFDDAEPSGPECLQRLAGLVVED